MNLEYAKPVFQVRRFKALTTELYIISVMPRLIKNDMGEVMTVG